MKADFATLRRPQHFFALSFGAGLVPKAPGTAGAIVALPIHWLIVQQPIAIQVLIILALAIFGIYVCGQTTRYLGEQDHQAIVWDETVGALMVLTVVPASALWWLAAILTFRLFDILKPWPIRLADHYFNGGTAIMADDIFAAMLSCALLIAVQLAWN